MADAPEPTGTPPVYTPPAITTYGSLTDMTANVLAGARLATGAGLESLSSPIGGGPVPVTPPPGTPVPVVETVGASSQAIPGGGTIPEGAAEVGGEQASGENAPEGSGSAPGDGAPGAGESGVLGERADGALAYTGYGAAFVGALGAGMAATGAVIRRKLTRRS